MAGMDEQEVKQTAANMLSAWGILADSEYFTNYCSTSNKPIVEYRSITVPKAPTYIRPQKRDGAWMFCY